MAVIDIHTHMLCEEWLELLESSQSRYYLAVDRTKFLNPDRRRIHVAGVPYSFHTPQPSYFDWDLRIRSMDEAGVDVAVVSLTAPQGNFGGEAVSARACRVSNNDMIAAQKRWPDRIRFLAALPWQYPRSALEELEYACENGAVGVLVLGNIEGDSPVADQFAPVWEAIDERALPVLVHPTAPPGVEVAARSGMSNAVGFHFDTTHALERMINTGFLDRYQRLKIIGSHAGGFLPFIIGRLDYQRETDRVPSEYLPRLYVDCMAFSRGAMDLTVEVFGPANILYGSDYPYGPAGGMQRARERLTGLPPGDRARVEGGNAERIFQL